MEKNNQNKVTRNHPAFNKNADPFYSIIMEGLKGEVDGEHFWDAVAENAVFEFLYHIPGFADKIEGRKAYNDLRQPLWQQACVACRLIYFNNSESLFLKASPLKSFAIIVPFGSIRKLAG